MKIRRMMCLLLCVLLMVGCIPFTAAAADADAAADENPDAEAVDAEAVASPEADDAEPADEASAEEVPAEEITADEAPEEEAPADEPAPLAEVPESELQNFWKLLQDKNDPDIKIAYLGGSVTAGSHASNAEETSWRALVGKWFTEKFGPGTSYNKNVTNVHAAIGSTGSYFGSYRVYQDAELGSDNPPDILFVEFAINDIYDKLSDKQVYVNYESIIRQAYKANPKINVIPVFTQDIDIANNLITTGREDSVYFEIQREVAAYYDLPQLNVGQALVEVMKEANGGQSLTTSSSVYKKYMDDTAHPTDTGYKIYADCVIEYLNQQLLSDEVSHNGEVSTVEIDSVPSLCEEKGYGKDIKESGRYISFKDAGFTQDKLKGWTLNAKDSASKLGSSNGAITTTSSGSSFAFQFKGTAVGFYNQGYRESGTISFSITGVNSPEKFYDGEVSLIKNYDTGLPFPAELMTGLDDEEWQVECVIHANDNGSRGELRYIYIDGDLGSIQVLDPPSSISGGFPQLYNPDNTVSSYNNGNQHVYVSSTGSVTVDGKEYAAFEDISQAIDALSPEGGTIYFTGNQTFADGMDDRGKITVAGLDSSATLTNERIQIEKGDVELKNLTFKGVASGTEQWTSTCGHLLTLGEGFKVSGSNVMKPSASQYSGGKPNLVDIYSGSFIDFGAIGGYYNASSRVITITGDSVYNLYGGSFGTIAGFSRDGNGSGNGHTYNGNATFNLYGGSFTGQMGTATTKGTLNGSLWYNVYGGTYSGNAKLVFGSNQDKISTVKGGHVIEIYSKEIQEAGDSLGGIPIGTTVHTGVTGKTIVVINNSELALQIGAAISAEAQADYQLMVEHGKAVPVFDDKTFELKGFEITSDVEGIEPSIDGEQLTKNGDGYYDIEAAKGVTRTIQFFDPDAKQIEIRFSDGEHSIEMLSTKDSVITIPTATDEMAQEGKVFAGWKLNGDDYYPGETYTVGEDNVTFDAQFVEKNAIETVYVKSSVTVSGVGLSKRSPVKTANEAIAIGGTDRDYTIVFIDYYQITGNVEFTKHTGVLTLSTEDDGVIAWNSQLAPNGPWIIKNAKLHPDQDNQFINTYGFDCTFGENVEIQGSYQPKSHMGLRNANSPYANYVINGSQLAYLFVGSFYITAGQTRNTDGAKITVNDGTVKQITIGADSFTGYNGVVNSTNSISVVVNGGTIGTLTVNSLIQMQEGARYQIILNHGGTITTIANTFDDKEKTIIRSGEGGLVDATKETGKFLITTEKAKIFIDGDEVQKADDNIYEIGTGEHTVTYADDDLKKVQIHFSDGERSIDMNATQSSEIIIPEPTEEMTQANTGKFFAGWKLDDADYYPGETYTVGEADATFEAQFVERSEIDTVYVKASAVKTGLGVSKRSPVKTIEEAITLGGTDRDYTIVFIDEYELSGNALFTKHTGVLTLSTEDEGVLAWDKQLAPNGPWIVKNAKIRPTVDNQFINTYGYDCAFGENVELLSSYKPKVHMGLQNANTGYSEFVINGSQLNKVFVGSFYVPRGSSRNTDGAKVIVNGGTVDTVSFGPDYYGTVDGTINCANSMSVVVNGGTIGSLTKNNYINLAEGMRYQIVLNHGGAITTINSSFNAENSTIIRSGEGGSVDTTRTTGEFEIITDKAKILIDGVEVPKAEDNLYTIGLGEHTVTYADGASVSVGGKNLTVDEDYTLTVDEGNAGIVDFASSVAPEKDGSLFLGWYYDGRDEAVEDGANLEAGTKIAAKFADFVTDTKEGTAVEECNFAVIGAQIRLTGEPAFRFLNRMDLDVLNAVLALNEDLVPKSALDKDIGYGFVMLPEKLLGDNELTKETDRAEVVPAVINFNEDDNSIFYTVCLTNVPAANYDKNYTVRAYITYLDAQGIEHTVYSESYATNMKAVAQAALDDEDGGLSEEDRAALQKIVGE